MPRLEQKIEQMLKGGQRPAIVLSPGAHIPPPKRGPGRPRIRDPKNPYSHFAGYMGKKGHPMCRAYGCKKELRVDQPAACSPECADDIFNEAISLLRRLGVTVEDVAQHLPHRTEP